MNKVIRAYKRKPDIVLTTKEAYASDEELENIGIYANFTDNYAVIAAAFSRLYKNLQKKGYSPSDVVLITDSSDAIVVESK